jgi:hypothetical protein
MVARGAKISEARRRAMLEGREAAKVRARIVGFPVECRVRVNTPREMRFNGKVGTVSEHNLGECGVRFSTGSPSVWFLPEQLIRLNGSTSSGGRSAK